MLARVLTALIIYSLFFLGVGCTSGGSEEESSEATQVEAQEGQTDETAESSEEGGEEETAEASEDGGDEDLAEEKEEVAKDETQEKDDEEISDIDEGDLDEEVAKTEETPKEEAPPAEVTATEQPKEEAPPVEMAQSADPAAPVTVEENMSGVIPVKKIKPTPYKVGGILANTVYLGRPGDTLESVSQKIYGSDKTQDLLAVNPNLKRGIKPGDKVYYNSPKRPTDSATMMTYYEDIGANPNFYEAKDGDNIRKVSKNLLGHEDAWKEVWATNEVDSKSEIPAGTKLKYWTGSEVASNTPPPQEVAAAEPPPPAAVEPPPPPPPAAEPPPPDLVAGSTEASNSVPPPPPAASVEPPPPPPPAEPPPPPVAKRSKAPVSGADDSALSALLNDPQMLTYVGGGAVLVIGLLAILGVARKRRSRIDFGQTQV